MTNLFPGLATGPVDHESTSVINVISDSAIDMGSLVLLSTLTLPAGELLPRVRVEDNRRGSTLAYGIAVGGDNDGIYGNGFLSTDDTTRATTGAGQGVKVVTRGRCLALVTGEIGSSGTPATISIGEPLSQASGKGGRLHLASGVETIVARALETVPSAQQDIIPVEVNYEGIF